MPTVCSPVARIAARGALAASLALLAGCATGRAYHDSIVTDRPDFTESPVAVPRGAVQLEMGDTYERTDGVRANTAGEMLFRIGVRSGAELRVGVPSFLRMQAGAPVGRADALTGFGDSYLGAKLDLIAEREERSLVPTMAIIVGSGLPTGSSAFRSRGPSPETKLLFGWSLSERWGLASNLNYSSSDEGDGRTQEAAASVSFAYSASERVGAYAEWFGGRPSAGAAAHYANGGVTYLLTSNQQLDLRAGTGLGGNRRDFFVGLGLSRRW